MHPGVRGAGDAGTVELERCSVLDCGHFGIGAAGPGARVSARECRIIGSKYEVFDQRDGAVVEGVEAEEEYD